MIEIINELSSLIATILIVLVGLILAKLGIVLKQKEVKMIEVIVWNVVRVGLGILVKRVTNSLTDDDVKPIKDKLVKDGLIKS